MPRKRILIVNNRIPYPLTDGGNIAVHAMVQGYKDTGWDVYLLAMNTTRHRMSAPELAGVYTDIFRFDAVEVNNDVTIFGVLRNFLFSGKPNHAERFFHKHFAKHLQEVIEDFKPDVVQIESIFLTDYLPYIKAISNARTVLRLHNLEHEVWGRFAEESKGVKGIYIRNLAKRIRKYEEAAWAKYNLLLPITDTDAEAVKKLLPETNILTVPVGIDAEPIADVVPVVNNQGYHIGAMDWLPNAEGIRWFLEQAWPQIHRLYPDFEFWFAGRKMPQSFGLNLPSGAHCAGEVPDAEAFIADKSVLFVPIKSGGGLRIKILEAMAKGKVVVSTNVGMQGIAAVSGTHFIAANTAEEFADAVGFILGNTARAHEIARNAAALVKANYNKSDIVNRLSERLSAIL